MENKIKVYTCLKCKHIFECEETNRCPLCGSLEIHKTDTKPLNLNPKNK